MARIGSLTVDLTLRSAQFIRDLNKTSAQVARNTSALSRTTSAIGTSLAGIFSAKLIKQISNINAESLRLAASMHGPLADAARTFNSEFEELQDRFKLGIAAGFLNEVGTEAKNSEEKLDQAGKAGAIFGRITGWVAGQVTQFVGTELPTFIKSIEDTYAAADEQARKFNDALFNQTTVAKTVAGTVAPQLTADMAAYGTELEIAQMKMESFWGASVQTTAFGEELLNRQKAYIDFVREAGSPLEQYRLAIVAIGDAQLDAGQKAALTLQAQAGLANTMLGAIGSMTAGAAQLFKDNKAIAYANAVINTAEAITSALKNPPGPPWSYVYAAGAALQGAAQIATIASTNPGTSKAISKPSGGGSSAVAKAGASSRSSGGAASQQSITINVEGDSFGPEHFKKLAAGIQSVISDGTKFSINAR